jgi:hypothetical protein
MSGNGNAGLCAKCRHREECKAPCAPVELYLAYENLAIYEKSGTLDSGEDIQILFTYGKEIRESSFPTISDRTAEAVDVLSTGENPFAGFNPHLKQTGLFIDRFFRHWSFEDLAVKYDLTLAQAKKHYRAAVDRLREVLEALDGQDKSIHNFDAWKQMVEERSGNFPLGVKWFLLNKLFSLRPAEIARLEGKESTSSAVRGMIIRVSDQLRAGELSLFEFDQEEAEAAKARLDAQRKKRRERYAKKKAPQITGPQ